MGEVLFVLMIVFLVLMVLSGISFTLFHFNLDEKLIAVIEPWINDKAGRDSECDQDKAS